MAGRSLGKPIEIISADLLNKPDVAAAIAGRWYDVEGVDVITDVPLTSVALAVQNISREKKKVLLITAAASADLTGKACSPYSVHWMDDTNALSAGTARAVVAVGREAMVLPHARLCVRRRHGTRRDRGDHGCRRHGAGQREIPAWHAGLFVIPFDGELLARERFSRCRRSAAKR